ncbi:hypothetical protein NE850_14650 [Paraburkholderia sp. USG1]|uniref:hypothetical protein n=1 Tax=Paraburkholderia sp. USG1 TaxID=2952268 RepID=UPI0012F67585|nr:hypothetical protein [Paraburkholderia sp. USG1]MDR8397582.1 hypothetical protein [Paraburkholderia sp. USG1]
MQISDSREILLMSASRLNARLDARTTNAVPALYVPEKLIRRECEIALRRCIRLPAFQTADKKTASSPERTKRFFVATQRPRDPIA